MKKLVVVLCALLLCTTFASAGYVKFKGSWEEGNTLYSNWYRLRDDFFYGKDVYPKRTSGARREKVCEDVEVEEKVKVCEENQNNYRTTVRTRCSTKGADREVICEEVIYRIPTRNRKVCHYELQKRTKMQCRYQYKGPEIGCQNPDGEYTNSLHLNNFQFTTDGQNWYDIPYLEEKQFVAYDRIRFRLQIPEDCSPKYYYNKAIFID